MVIVDYSQQANTLTVHMRWTCIFQVILIYSLKNNSAEGILKHRVESPPTPPKKNTNKKPKPQNIFLIDTVQLVWKNNSLAEYCTSHHFLCHSFDVFTKSRFSKERNFHVWQELHGRGRAVLTTHKFLNWFYNPAAIPGKYYIITLGIFRAGVGLGSFLKKYFLKINYLS